MSKIYAQQKRPAVKAPAQENKSVAAHAPSLVGGESRGDLNDLMLARFQQHFQDNQIPTAEAEADRIAASVRGARTPEEVKQQLGEKMGADFSDIRFHTDSASAGVADAMGARAYTSGKDVTFGSGGFDAATAAHELVHTVQQGVVSSTMSTLSAPTGGVQMKKDPFASKRRKAGKYDKRFKGMDAQEKLKALKDMNTYLHGKQINENMSEEDELIKQSYESVLQQALGDNDFIEAFQTSALNSALNYNMTYKRVFNEPGTGMNEYMNRPEVAEEYQRRLAANEKRSAASKDTPMGIQIEMYTPYKDAKMRDEVLFSEEGMDYEAYRRMFQDALGSGKPGEGLMIPGRQADRLRQYYKYEDRIGRGSPQHQFSKAMSEADEISKNMMKTEGGFYKKEYLNHMAEVSNGMNPLPVDRAAEEKARMKQLKAEEKRRKKEEKAAAKEQKKREKAEAKRRKKEEKELMKRRKAEEKARRKAGR